MKISHRLKLALLLIVFVVGFTLVGYRLAQGRVSAEEAIVGNYPQANTYQFYGQRNIPGKLGGMLFFAAPPRNAANGEPQDTVYGYYPVKRDWLGRWQIGSAGRCHQEGQIEPADAWIAFQAHLQWIPYGYYDGTGEYSILCGKAFTAQVASVEVVFEDGTVLRDDVTDGLFVVARRGCHAIDEVRVRDGADELLQRIGPVHPAQSDDKGVTVPLTVCHPARS